MEHNTTIVYVLMNISSESTLNVEHKYIYMYLIEHKYIYMYMYLIEHKYIYMYMYLIEHKYIYMYMYLIEHKYIYMYMYLIEHKYIYMYMYLIEHKYIYMYMYNDISVCESICKCDIMKTRKCLFVFSLYNSIYQYSIIH